MSKAGLCLLILPEKEERSPQDSDRCLCPVGAYSGACSLAHWQNSS